MEIIESKYLFTSGVLVGVILTLILLGKGPRVFLRWISETIIDWDEKYAKRVKRSFTILINLFWVLYGVFFVSYLIDHFWSYWVTLDSKHQTLEGLKQTLLAAPGVVALITVGAFASLVGALTFVVRIPFLRWEQIKIFGFEYKRQLKEVTDEASRAFDDMLEEQQVRFSLFQSMLEDEFYDGLMQITASGNLQYVALKRIVELLKDIYKQDPLSVNIDTGVVIVDANHEIRNLHTVPIMIQPYIQRCVSEQKLQSVDRKGFSFRAIPIQFSGQTDPYYIVYLESDEFGFNEFDEKLIEIAHDIVELQLSYMYYDRQQIS